MGDVFRLPNGIQELKAAMLGLEQFEPPTRHHFHGGMYCREVYRPAGILIVGKVHKREHFYLLVFGTLTVRNGDDLQTITGPCLLESRPGDQRAVFAQTDALCMTFHRTDATTVEEAERELVEDDPDSPFGSGNALPLKVIA